MSITKHSNHTDNVNLLPEELEALTQLAGLSRHALVTGAGGFLGKAICQRLIAAGIAVTGFARGHYPELEAMGVNMVSGDICDLEAVTDAMAGCDLVFHVASKAGVWGSKESYFAPNVLGCDNLLKAAVAHGIDSFVYTSTPSVTFAGEDESGIDESAPYASRFLNYYGESKAIAEQRVTAANGTSLPGSSTENRLNTVSLRPHLIWGPEDPHLVPRVIARARAGKLKLVGKADKLVDTIYVGNAAYAHILAALTLKQNPQRCAGKCYFLSNDEPITMAAMLNKILACAELPKVEQRVPASVAYLAGALLEGVYGLLGKREEPIMTRFVARQLSTSHYFDISAAKCDLNYRPLVSIDEGMVQLSDWLKREKV
ncbi:NAD-dependent epimerase/dehydratase family protein [Shewanella alkalitolerans]|uniref:2-alkyl-3-oxoalkanoate reductase n=1 Tax=Shewanella alkalitolerans TaxID=2864209 RepID=UPI001C659294|nr:2-alkyl-3-oxoalkanoate reductase [Shewanella alkalitolerans]QYJ99259.1 NAD-dependent epimerase/dehydratase family protein [Shewanella alkalitolerans]